MSPLSILSNLSRAAKPQASSLRSRSYATLHEGSNLTNQIAIGASVAAIIGGGYFYFSPALKIDSASNPKAEVAAHNKSALEKAISTNDHSKKTDASGALVKDTWTAFKLSKVEPYNHNSNVYHFEFPEESKDKVSGLQVAGAILVRTPEGENEVRDEKGKPVIRPYTPTSSEDETGFMTLLIKEYKDGKLTSHIANMKPGDDLLFKGPIPKYKYEPNTFDRGLCVAGGSGITPMWQMIRHCLNKADDKTKWTLLFSNVSEKDILLRKEWESLAKQHPGRLDVRFVVDKPEKGWKGETGFVTPDMISKVFPKKDDKVMAFVCGPPPQVNSLAGPKDGPRQGELKGAFKDLGYTSQEVYKF